MTMKKNYITPAAQTIRIDAHLLMSTSLPIDSSKSGDECLVKQDWNIWGGDGSGAGFGDEE